MKKNILFTCFIFLSYFAKSQTIDSLFFNLYTDSLKKGTYNYINVDAKLSNGKYLPLTDDQIKFTATNGKFEKNCLIIPLDFKEEKVTITIFLKSNISITKSITLSIKRKNDDENLKTENDVLNIPATKTSKPKSVKKKKTK